MNYKKLGNTEIKVSEIAFGTVELGMPYGLNMANAKHNISKKDAIYLLHKALDEGINFYDTARLYGNSEDILGQAFERNRNEIVIASKCRHFRLSDGKIPPKSSLKKVVYDSIQESLKKLKTDYIDVFMLHYADLEILEIDELYEVFSELIDKGIIRVPGISVYEEEETKRALEKGFWRVIQLPYNLMDQKHGKYFLEAHNKGVGIVARSVLMRGLLTDKSFSLHPKLKEVQDHIHLYKSLFNHNIENLPALAMKFVASIKEVSSILIGIDKMEFLVEAIDCFNGEYLNEIELKQAKKLEFPDQEFLNLAQWDKNGWL